MTLETTTRRLRAYVAHPVAIVVIDGVRYQYRPVSGPRMVPVIVVAT